MTARYQIPTRLCFSTVALATETRYYEVYATPHMPGWRAFHLHIDIDGARFLSLPFPTEMAARKEFERRVESATDQAQESIA